MTVVAEAPTGSPVRPADPPGAVEWEAAPAAAQTAADAPGTAAPVRPLPLILSWVAITVVGVALVLVLVSPLTEQRDQQRLLDDYRGEIEDASFEAFGLPGVEVPTLAPSAGAAVGILDIDGIDLRQVVIEGTDPEQTRQGPGHVVGTAGPGQPGNSVVVGRSTLFGGAFGSLDDLDEGDRIVVSTAQGQSVYVVRHVGTHEVIDEVASGDEVVAEDEAVAGDATPDGGDAGEAEDAVLPAGVVTRDELYGPSADDRLTLITSGSGAPWATDEAQVVVATMETTPFQPTPQGGRTSGDDGRRGGGVPSAGLALALLVYIGAVVATVWFHRRLPWRSAYLLSMPLLIALTIVLADQVAQILPAWT